MSTEIGKGRAVRQHPAGDRENGPRRWMRCARGGQGQGGRSLMFLAPDVPELVELLGTVEHLLLDLADDEFTGLPDGADDELFEPGSWWAWLGLAAMAAAGAPVPPVSAPPPASAVREEALAALGSLRRALAPALHLDPAAARPFWRGSDRTRLVAFRVAVVEQETLDVLTRAARYLRSDRPAAHGDRAALECLLAVLIPVDDRDPEPAVLASSAAFAGPVGDAPTREVVLDHRAREAHRHVAVRLLDALHRLHDQDAVDRPTDPPRDPEDDL